MADLDSIKIVLRSLLISRGESIPADLLHRDYKHMEGREVPYSALGYRDFVSFLRSIPDAVRVSGYGLVSAVTTNETAHIAQLVALQRKPRRRTRPGRPPHAMNPFTICNNRSFSGPPSTSHQPSRRPSRQGERSPRFSRMATETKFNSHSPAQNGTQYEPPQYTKPGWSTACTQFFQDTTSKLHHCKENGILHPLVQQIMNRHAPANLQLEEVSSTSRILPDGYHDNEEGKFSSDESYEEYTSRDVVKGQNQNEDYKDVYYSQEENEDTLEKCKSEDSEYYQNGAFDDMGPSMALGEQRTPTIEVTHMTSSRVSDAMKKNFQSIMEEHPDGVWCCELPDIYEKKFLVPLHFNELGYTSVSQMASDIPDIFTCKRIDSGDWKLFDSHQSLPTTYDKEGSLPKVPEHICLRIRKLASKYPSGVHIDKFNLLYQMEYNRSLLDDVPSFDSVESLLLTLQDSAVHLRYVRRDCYIYPLNYEDKNSKALEAFDSKLAAQLSLYPGEVFGFGETYPPADLSKDIGCGSYIEILVGEVYSPHRFWCMQRGANHHLRLDRLMDDLQIFYGKHGDKYMMPDATILADQCCVALYMKEWHRAVILSLPNEIEVEVLYIDYGTIWKVTRDELRFIHKDFCELPRQAVHASLFGIEPATGSKYTKEANQSFLELVQNKHLVALVQKIDHSKPFLEVFLIDTSGQEDIHLNDVLVNQGHARFLVTSAPGEEASAEELAPSAKFEPTSPLSSPQVSMNSHPTCAPPSHPTCAPPPGFQDSSIFIQAGANMPQNPGLNSRFGIYGVENTNTSMNPILNHGVNGVFNPAAVLGAGLHPAGVMAYQQWIIAQQFAMLHNIQQNIAAAALLGSQGKGGSASLVGSPWLQPPVVSEPTRSVVSEIPHTPNSKSDSVQEEEMSESTAQEIESQGSDDNGTASEGPSTTDKESDSTSVSRVSVEIDVDSSDSYSGEKLKATKNRIITCELSVKPRNSNKPGKRKESKSGKEKKRGSSTTSSCSPVASDNSSKSSDLKQTRKNNSTIEILPAYVGTHPVSTSSSDAIIESEVVDCWEELADVGDIDVDSQKLPSDAAPACSSISPKSPTLPATVQGTVTDLSSLTIESAHSEPHFTEEASVNFWKIVEADGKSLTLFNIEYQGFVSTDELAQQFTSFSSRNIVVRVLEHKNFDIPFKKLERRDCLPLFAALDGIPEDDVGRFGLMLNKNGNVTGTLHLTPLGNIPSMLMVLGITNSNLIRDFQNIRDTFNPQDDCWWECFGAQDL